MKLHLALSEKGMECDVPHRKREVGDGLSTIAAEEYEDQWLTVGK